MMKTRNITRVLLVALMVAMTAVGGYAQDSYREALKDFLSANGSIDMIKTSLLNINEILFKPSDNESIEELTERYFQERFEDEYVKMVEPAFKERDLTEEDLRELTGLLSTPEGKNYATHMMAWLQKMPGSLASAVFTHTSFDSEMDQWSDTRIEIDPDVNADYTSKFRQLKDKVMPEDMEQEVLNDGLKEDTTGEKALMVKWLFNNLETILLNSAHNYLTEENLDYGLLLSTHDSYLKTMNINFNQQSMNLFIDCSEWMEANGAQTYSLDEDEYSYDRLRKLNQLLGIDLPTFGPSHYDGESDYFGIDEFEGYFNGEITERDQLTSSIYIKSSQDLVDLYDIEITYKGEDGINVTDTITTTHWVKTVVNKNFPTQIGIVTNRFLLKPGVKADKQAYDLMCDCTFAAQEFGYNFMIFEEKNVPADEILNIFNYYDFDEYQEHMMKKWGVYDMPFRGTFTVEKEDDPDHPFNFTHDK